MTKKLSVLIVDDHPGMCSTLKDILESEEHKVVTASSGKAAISICKNQRFDVILMDIRMPDLNGVETYLRIKNYTEGTRVFMMSAYSVDKLKEEALNEGAIAFLQKPLDIEKTLKLIQQSENPPVLIVMENQHERERLATQLSGRNYRAYSAGTAEEAVSLAHQIRFNLIIIETSLTGKSGLELFVELKKILPSSATIMLSETDKISLGQAKEAVRLNAYTYLENPLDMDELLATLEKLKRKQISGSREKSGESYE